MSNAIETRGLCYRAGRNFELRDLSLAVPAGSIYGFLGPNGSGKTTTIRLLLGMTRRRSGSIQLLGREVPEELPAALAEVGYVPERPHLYPLLTVGETMRYHRSFYPTWDASWAERLLQSFELTPERRIARLSKGETGKLMMLLALAQRPKLLILDEPTDGLDPMVRRDVLTALIDYVSDSGATVFISSHLVHELERICDWVGVLDRGMLLTQLPMAAFKRGIKRVRISLARANGNAAALPATVLSRTRNPLGGDEFWVLQDWSEDTPQQLEANGAEVREVQDLDLEDVFVELLRGSRQPV